MDIFNRDDVIPIDSDNELVIVERDELAEAHTSGYEWAINLIADPNYDKIPRYERLDLPSLRLYNLTPKIAIVQPKGTETVYVQIVGPEDDSRVYARCERGSLEKLVESLIEDGFMLGGFEDGDKWLVSSVTMPESVPETVLGIVEKRRNESKRQATELG